MTKTYPKILYVRIALVILFVTILTLVLTANIGWFDDSIGTIFERNDTLTTFMKSITHLGDGWILVLIATLITIFVKNKKIGMSLFLDLGIISLLNSGLKKIVRRPRPLIEHLVDAGGYSFPSGHSATAMAFYGMLIYLIYRKCPNVTIKWALIVALTILIVLIGMSRVYLGVHYPSDVLGGFTFGLLHLTFYIKLARDIWPEK